MNENAGSSSAARDRFRCLKQGQGATFTFDSVDGGSADKSNLLGTTNCLTCVGVYLPINKNRRFVAHINAYVTESDERVKTQQLTWAEGAKTRKRVLTKLYRHSIEHDWWPQDVKNAMEDDMRAVVICHHMDDRPDRPGQYVLEALEKFTKCKLWRWFERGRGSEAFTLNQNDNAVTYYDGGAPLHDLYVHDKVYTGVGDWDFEIAR